MKNIGLHILLCILLCTSAIPAQAIKRQDLIKYASSLKGKKKAELKKAIYDICQPKRVLAYGSGEGKTWAGFYKTDRVEGTQECINRYSDRKFYFTSTTSVINGMNIEHSFPKSWWGGTTNNAYKDLFNLYPSESEANSSKSNYPMGKVTNPNLLNDYEKVGSGPAGSLGNIRLCEPNDAWKGDFCRSYFYMATVYQNLTWQGTQGLQQLENNQWPTLREWAYKLYLEWTRNDKVLDMEVKRNEAIYGIQGNRNLYIDFPFLAEYVWGDSVNVAFDPYTSITTATDDNRYETAEMPGGDGGDTDNPGGESGDGEDNPNPGGDEDDGPDFEGDFVFAETFTGCNGTGANDDAWNGSIASTNLANANMDNSGWTFTSGYAASYSVRLGTGSKAGSITTPAISGLKNSSFTLYFDAAAWDSSSESTTLKISATNCTLSESQVVMAKGAWTTYAITVTNVTGDIKITFSGNGSNNRFFLDNVLIPSEEVFFADKEYICGDVNHDGELTVSDLTDFIKILQRGWAGYNVYAADTDCNSKITVNDIVGMIDRLLGKK